MLSKMKDKALPQSKWHLNIVNKDNYDRIKREQINAMNNVQNNTFKNLITSEQDFFYKYKKISISQNSLYKVSKSYEELKEDKMVQLAFRRHLQFMKQEIENKKAIQKRQIRKKRRKYAYSVDEFANLGHGSIR